MRKSETLPAAIAAAVALVGTIAILWMDFGPGTGVEARGITMVTAAAVERAGATIVPAVRPR
jgi:hypothetical protein